MTTVRSQDKADAIARAHPSYGKDKLDFAIVEDIAQLNAFDKAVLSDPPFETVIHTASPFHFSVTDTKKDLLDPAINGTTGILRAIKKSAPTVKRVVVTSSFAAIVDPKKSGGYKYSEKDWNPVTMEEATNDPSTGYRASKTFAEKAAWDFVEKEKPNFEVTTCNPPLVLGPIVHYLNSLDKLNTSNQRVRDIMTGVMKEKIAPTGIVLWIDVRDLALAHVLAAEKKDAAGKRFFLVAGTFSNTEIARVIAKNYPDLKDKLPSGDALAPGELPPADQRPDFDNMRAKEVLGLKFRSLEESITDTVKSLQAVEK